MNYKEHNYIKRKLVSRITYLLAFLIFLDTILIDKKKDIRILLKPEIKQLIKKLSFQYNTYPTILTTDILTEALYRNKEFDEVEYPIVSKHLVVTKLDKETFEILQGYCVEWDCSIRKAAHRVFVNSLRREGHFLLITNTIG
ncbi:hypothetical protein [Bacillus sp. AFS053548]|uniref:hypothetical protein n=1 Tax=Bacillus sp. AFS053548 TaxID=2033505 RepID=UPI000BFB4931|nr:hypothetical protein [Bacillus sp. AFS053548]PGM51145.1 hypothetical protein CN946_20065 [Bacillus sp. AFS053548]